MIRLTKMFFLLLIVVMFSNTTAQHEQTLTEHEMMEEESNFTSEMSSGTFANEPYYKSYIAKEDYEAWISEFGGISSRLVTANMSNNAFISSYLFSSGNYYLSSVSNDNNISGSNDTSTTTYHLENIGKNFKTNPEDVILSAETSYSGTIVLTYNLDTKKEEIYVVGDNSSGMFGTGDTRSITTPYKIPDTVIDGLDGYPIKVGITVNASFILTSTGKFYVSGTNDNGILGMGSSSPTTTSYSYSEMSLPCTACTITDFETYTDPVTLNRLYLVGSDDNVYALGHNRFGALGIGNINVESASSLTNMGATSPTKVLVVTGEVRDIDTGTYGVVIATSSGIYIAGHCANGICGRTVGSIPSANYSSSYMVHTAVTPSTNIGSVVSVSMNFRGVAAVVDNGLVYAWGGYYTGTSANNSQFHCVNTTSQYIATPSLISNVIKPTDGTNVVNVFGTFYNTYYQTEGGEIKSCGYNYNGSLYSGITDIDVLTRTSIPVVTQNQLFSEVSIGNESITFNYTLKGEHYYPASGKIVLKQNGVEVDTISTGYIKDVKYQFSNLSPDTYYEIYYENGSGKELWRPYKFITSISIPSAEITENNVGFNDIDIDVELEDPLNKLHKSEIYLYKMEGGVENEISKKDLAVGVTNIKFENLDSNGIYMIKIIIDFDIYGFLREDVEILQGIYYTLVKELVEADFSQIDIAGGDVDIDLVVTDVDNSLLVDPVTGDYINLTLVLEDLNGNIVTIDKNGDPIILPILTLGLNEVELRELELSKRYVVKVLATYNIGFGERTDEIIAAESFQTIIASKPSSMLTLDNSSFDYLEVSVEIIDNDNTILDGSQFLVAYSNDIEESRVEVIGGNSTINLTGLRPNVIYNVALEADYNRGSGLIKADALITESFKTKPKVMVSTSLILEEVTSISIKYRIELVDTEGSLTSDVVVILENIDDNTTETLQTIPLVDIQNSPNNIYINTDEKSSLPAYKTYSLRLESSVDIGYGDNAIVLGNRITKTIKKSSPVIQIVSNVIGKGDIRVTFDIQDDDETLLSTNNGLAILKVFDTATDAQVGVDIDISGVGVTEHLIDSLELNKDYYYKISVKYNTGSRDVDTDEFTIYRFKTLSKDITSGVLDITTRLNDQIIVDITIDDADLAVKVNANVPQLKVQLWEEQYYTDETGGTPIQTLDATVLGYVENQPSQVLVGIDFNGLNASQTYVIKVKAELETGISIIDGAGDNYEVITALIATDPLLPPVVTVENDVISAAQLEFDVVVSQIANVNELKAILSTDQGVVAEKDLGLELQITSILFDGLESNKEHILEIEVVYRYSNILPDTDTKIINTQVYHTPYKNPILINLSPVDIGKDDLTYDIIVDDKDNGLVGGTLNGLFVETTLASTGEVISNNQVPVDENGHYNGVIQNYKIDGLLPGREYNIKIVGDRSLGNVSEIERNIEFAFETDTTNFKIDPVLNTVIGEIEKDAIHLDVEVNDVDTAIESGSIIVTEITHITDTDKYSYCDTAMYKANEADYQTVGNPSSKDVNDGANKIVLDSLEVSTCYRVLEFITFDSGLGSTTMGEVYLVKTDVKQESEAYIRDTISVENIDVVFSASINDEDSTIIEITLNIEQNGAIVSSNIVSIEQVGAGIQIEDTNQRDNKLLPLTEYKIIVSVRYDIGDGENTKVLGRQSYPGDEVTIITDVKKSISSELHVLEESFDFIAFKVNIVDVDYAITIDEANGKNIIFEVIEKSTGVLILSENRLLQEDYVEINIENHGIKMDEEYEFRLITNYNDGLGEKFDEVLITQDVSTRAKLEIDVTVINTYQDIRSIGIQAIVVDAEDAIVNEDLRFQFINATNGNVVVEGVLVAGATQIDGSNEERLFEGLATGNTYTYVITTTENRTSEVKEVELYRENFSTDLRNSPYVSFNILTEEIDGILVEIQVNDMHDAIQKMDIVIKKDDDEIQVLEYTGEESTVTISELDSNNSYVIEMHVIYDLGDGNELNEILDSVEVSTQFDTMRALRSAGYIFASVIVAFLVYRKVKFQAI